VLPVKARQPKGRIAWKGKMEGVYETLAWPIKDHPVHEAFAPDQCSTPSLVKQVSRPTDK
jgi:hypothetical protein